MKLINIIQQDNLEQFKENFILENWRDSITKIENYGGITKYTPTVSFNDCDVFKYAIHCNADKIFNYLLPLVDTEKHGDNYGWPILAMAIKNQRYDYAEAIINHPSFDLYPMYHINTFKHIDESQKNPRKHIDFLFKYVSKFDKYDFKTEWITYYLVDIICYSEETFKKFDYIYKKKMDNNNLNLIDMFNKKFSVLGEQIFYNEFKPFILDKLTDKQFRSILESVMDNKIIFSYLFKSQHAKQGLEYLLKQPDLLQEHFKKNVVIPSYLPLDCLIYLIENNIDLWIEDETGAAPIDFMIKNDLNHEKTLYFVNNYTQKVFDRLSEKNRHPNTLEYCKEKLLSKKNIKIH